MWKFYTILLLQVIHRLGNLFEGLSQSLQEDFLLALDRLSQGETLGMPLSKPLFNIALGLHELRFKERRSIYRVFYFIKVQLTWYNDLNALKNQ